MARAKKRPAFLITINGSTAKPPLRLNFSRPLMALVILAFAAILYLAGLSVYNFVTVNNSANGDNLAYRSGSSTRENNLENLINQLNSRNQQLQQENQKYKQDIADLDTRVKQLADSIETLKAFAKQLQDRLGASGGPQLPAIPTPSGSTGGNNNTAYLFGNNGILVSSNVASATYVTDAQNYYQQFNQVLTQLQGVDQTLNDKKQSIADLSKKIQDYQTELSQTFSAFSIDSQRATSKDVTDSFSAPGKIPVNGPVSSPFGWRPSPFHIGASGFHAGIDIAVPLLTEVRATKAGYVTYAGYDDSYGWRVEITHPGGWLTLYAHNTTLLVKVGQYVQEGDIISLSGSTGASTGPHVHYEVHYNGVPVNPVLYIKVPLKYENL